MTIQRVKLETKDITDRESFFAAFSELMGFPDFFGRNWDAWIDCMRHVDDPADGLSQVTVATGELLHVEVADAEAFAHRAPELFQHFMDCTAFVNQSRQQMGRPPVLALILL